MMRMSEFKELPLEEQLAILYREGVYVGKSKKNEFTKLLFQLEYFYIEITYLSYRMSIDKIYYTKSTSILELYLEQVDVEYLVTW